MVAVLKLAVGLEVEDAEAFGVANVGSRRGFLAAEVDHWGGFGSQANRSDLQSVPCARTLRFRVEPDGMVKEPWMRPLRRQIALLMLVLAGRVFAGQATDVPSRSASPVSFVNDVLPVLSKVGCNAGTCHGSSGGKGGFKLSLRGFAPEQDHDAICRDSFGRRVDGVRPQNSLLLLKPTAAVAHRGGQVLDPDSPGYEILLAWLRQRSPGPSEQEPRLIALTLARPSLSLEPNQRRSLRVEARFSDGSRRDVTRWARYDTNESTVAVVDDNGFVQAVGPGKAAVSAAYQDRVAAVEITVPYPDASQPRDYSTLPRANYIDDLVIAQWEALRLWPSPPADDATFLRRVYLDVTGTLPEPADVRAFWAATDPGKRDAVINRLLDSPDSVDMWAQKWGDVFRASREWLGEKAVWTFHRYLRDRIQRNVPWDQVVRELIAGAGNSSRTGPANFYRLQKVFNQLELWPLTAAETTAQTFLGIRIQCARCHNHPKDRWTQADYYGLASFFARVGAKKAADGSVVIHDRGTGEIKHPRLGRALPPKALDGPTMASDAAMTRRRFLAEWITAPDNPFFARATANRIWRHFMGRGLVEPVDELRTSNPPTNAALLDALARDLVDHGFDLKHLMRRILRSRTYQLASTPTPDNRADTRFYSHYLPKRMAAEQLLDAIGRVTGIRERLPGLPVGFRAQQLPDTKVASAFLDQFGRPLRRVASCECERIQEPNLKQALELMHSPVLVDRVTADEGFVARRIEAGATDAGMVEEMYLRVVGRPPTKDETTAIVKEWTAVAATSDAKGRARLRRAFHEDLLWALLNSKEFLFNH